MKQSDKDLILKITKLCLDSTCDTFHPFIDYAPHAKMLDVRVYVDGWSGRGKPIFLGAYYQQGDIKMLQLVHDELVKLINDHEFRYSPAQIAKTKAGKTANRIAELKLEITELEK